MRKRGKSVHNPYYAQAKRVVIPVRVQGGELRPFYGGDMPKLHEGSLLDLVGDEDAFVDRSEISRFDLEDTAILLSSGSQMFATMSIRGSRPQALRNIPADPPLSGNNGFIQFQIDGDLVLRFRGTKLAELEECPCSLPSLNGQKVASVNDAYTKLSEHYEPWRRSHTGNVFEKVYCFEQDKAIQLDILRKHATAEFEKKLFHQSGTLPLEGRAREEPK
jgi:hypothetical protein